jgi:hypothetical protein
MAIESNLFRIDESPGIFTLYLDEDAGDGSSKALNFFKRTLSTLVMLRTCLGS